MKVLQLCHRVPYPEKDGGNIAMMSLAKAMAFHGVDIKMLTLNTKKHFVDLSSVPQEIIRKYAVESMHIDTTVKTSEAFFNLFTSESYNVIRFYSKAFGKKLIETLKETSYDIVLIESLFMAPYIKTVKENSKAKIVLRAHNVEYMIWDRLSSNEKNILKKKYFELLTRRLKKYELEMINEVDALLPITSDDANIFKESGSKTPMLVVPMGVDMIDYPDQSPQANETDSMNNTLSLFHLGAMDWLPNLEGIQWFLKDCGPLIQNKFPELKIFLAGRGFPASIKDDAPDNVICDGEIMDAKKYMGNKQIMIVPLKSGGGMRVKIIQGMALGKTIISTTIGSEGINCTDGKNILIANSPQEFLSQIEKCLTDKNFCYMIAKNARQLIAENYSNEAIGKNVKSFFEKLMVKL